MNVQPGCGVGRHDDAHARVAVDARRFDVDRPGHERGAQLGRGQGQVLRLDERGDGRGVRRGGRGAEERRREAAGARHGHAVGGGEVGFSQHLPARRGDVARRDRRAVAREEDPPRTIRAVRLHDVGGGADGLGRDGRGGGCRDAEGIGGGRGRMAVGLAGRGDRQLAPVGIQVQEARRGAGLLRR